MNTKGKKQIFNIKYQKGNKMIKIEKYYILYYFSKHWIISQKIC